MVSDINQTAHSPWGFRGSWLKWILCVWVANRSDVHVCVLSFYVFNEHLLCAVLHVIRDPE